MTLKSSSNSNSKQDNYQYHPATLIQLGLDREVNDHRAINKALENSNNK